MIFSGFPRPSVSGVLAAGVGILTLALWLTQISIAQPAPPGAGAYRIRNGDKLTIKFPYQPELSEAAVIVRPDGLINLSLIDEIKAGGLSVAELRSNLEKAYREFLVNPLVSVSLLESVPSRVFVGGQVARPGSYELRSGNTLLQAVVLAGGFTREAHRKYVLHARAATNGSLHVSAVDTTRMIEVNGSRPEISLEDGDYVFVPDSRLSKISRIIEAFQLLIPNLIYAPD